MVDHKTYLHAKFHIDERFDAMDAFILSENQERVDKWPVREYEAERPTPHENHSAKSLSIFCELSRSYEKSIDEFQEIVPFLMTMTPILLNLMDDRQIRQFVKLNGDLLGRDGGFETYRIGIDRSSEINKRLQLLNCIRAGASSLPDVFFVGVVSAYDVFLSNLIRRIFTVVPELLSTSDRNISLKDLIEIGSVEAARDRIIEKEVETVIRKSHPEQIGWLSAKLNMPLTKGLRIWPTFVELCERRNLLTHTGGLVSAQYLKVCQEHGCAIEGATIGQQLKITPKYYRESVQTLLEFGMKLTQVVWRKLVPGQVNDADQELSQFAYRLIARRKYGAASTMLRFGLYEMTKHGNDATRKMMVVNYANAVKLGGDKVQALKILDEEDWSAATDDYKICVAAVKDDGVTVVGMMKAVVHSGRMNAESFREWPVFETLRTEPEFASAFEKCFGEQLMVETQAKLPETTSEYEFDVAETEPRQNTDAIR